MFISDGLCRMWQLLLVVKLGGLTSPAQVLYPSSRLYQLLYMVVHGEHFKGAKVRAARASLGSHTVLLLLNSIGQHKSQASPDSGIRETDC